MVAPHDTLSAFTVFTAPLQDVINRLRAVGEKLSGYRARMATLSDGL